MSALPTIDLCHVPMKRVQWLWPRRIPMEEVTIIQGDPGMGKGHVVADIAARFTSRGKMPFENVVRDPCRVIWIGTEDDNARTLKPRLLAAGADVQLVTSVEESQAFHVSFPSSTADVRELIRTKNAADPEHKVRLLVIDPLGEYVDKHINLNNNTSREVLTCLQAMAREFHLAVVVIHHLNKTTSANHQAAIHRGAGNVSGISGKARSVLMVAQSPDSHVSEGRIVLASVKHNLSAAPDSLEYDIRELDVTEGSVTIPTSKIQWLGTSSYNADQLAQLGSNNEVGALDAAKEFLQEFLGKGPRWVKDVRAEAVNQDLSWTGSVRRAADELDVEKRWNRAGEPSPGIKEHEAWVWALPAS